MNVKDWYRQVKKMFVKRSLVLMYHRIADVPVDPWQLAVSPAHFEEHLQVLRDTYPLLTAKVVAAQLQGRSIVKSAVSLTFDDGYADNYLAAKPLLEKYSCPATFFIASSFIGQQQEFWWDELVSILLLSPQLPAVLTLDINNETLTFQLADDGRFQAGDQQKHASWHWPDEPPTRRARIYLAVWERLKPLPGPEIARIMTSLRTWAGDAYSAPPANFPMSQQQLVDLFNHPLIDIGIHTVTHPALSLHAKNVQLDEIAGCKKQLEQLGGRKMELVAYPYGDHNQTTISTVKELHLSGAFTTADTAIDKNTLPYQIARLQVKNWNGTAFKEQLTAWLNGR